MQFKTCQGWRNFVGMCNYYKELARVRLKVVNFNRNANVYFTTKLWLYKTHRGYIKPSGFYITIAPATQNLFTSHKGARFIRWCRQKKKNNCNWINRSVFNRLQSDKVVFIELTKQIAYTNRSCLYKIYILFYSNFCLS